KNVDLSIQDLEGNTALHHVIHTGNIELLNKILSSIQGRENAIDIINLENAEGESAILLAYKNKNREAFDALLQNGAKIDDKIINMILLKDEKSDKEVLIKILDKNPALFTNIFAFEAAIRLIGDKSIIDK